MYHHYIISVWQPNLRDQLQAYKAAQREMDYAGLRLTKRGLKMDALDFSSDQEVANKRAEDFLEALGQLRGNLDRDGRDEGTRWWPLTVQGVVNTVLVEKRRRARLDEEERRRAARVGRMSVDEKAMRRVREWRGGVRPAEEAQEPWLWAQSYEGVKYDVDEDQAVEEAVHARVGKAREEREREMEVVKRRDVKERRVKERERRERERQQDEMDVEDLMVSRSEAARSERARSAGSGESRSNSNGSTTSTAMVAKDTNTTSGRRRTGSAKRKHEE